MTAETESPRTRRAILAAGLAAGTATVASALVLPSPVNAASGSFDSASASTPAVLGNNTAASSNPEAERAVGVLGQSASTSGAGVYGWATATTGWAQGVYGQSNATGGVGVLGLATAITGNTFGVSGLSYAPGGTGVRGYSEAGDGTGTGVLGESNGRSGVGVYGTSANNSTGVIGKSGARTPAASPKTGVYGYADQDAGSRGVYGQSTSGMGVLGKAATGTGVRGESATGVDLAAGGSGRLLQKPTAATGAPSSGTYAKGEMIRDAGGAMWMCTAAGTPGTWRRVASVASGARGGALTLLPTPARVYDSRSAGGALRAGSLRTISVANAIAAFGGALAVPGGAVGVTYNLTITSTVVGGWLALLPRGATFGGTSSINWTASGQTIANGGVVGLGGDRQLDVRCASNSGCSTQFILNITGYYI